MYDFNVTDEEYQLLIDVIDNHECDCSEFGGLWSYIFTPTSIGHFLVLKCNNCNNTWNITEIANEF